MNTSWTNFFLQHKYIFTWTILQFFKIFTFSYLLFDMCTDFSDQWACKGYILQLQFYFLQLIVYQDNLI